MFALSFHSSIFAPSIVVGIADACIYGMVAVALVLNFRISRTLAFVNYGFLELGSTLYWWFVYPTDKRLDGVRPGLSPGLALLLVLGISLAIGLLYGFVLSLRRVATLSPLTRTLISLGSALVLAGIATEPNWQIETDAFPHSPFGQGKFKILGAYVTHHRLGVTLITVGVTAVIAFVIKSTRTGVAIRSLADDVEASQWSGVNLRRVGMGVYAVSAVMSAMAGAFLFPLVGGDPNDLLSVFLRGLVIAVIGAFESVTAALIGAFAIATFESTLQSGVFGTVDPSTDQIAIMIAVLFAAVFLSARHRSAFAAIRSEWS